MSVDQKATDAANFTLQMRGDVAGVAAGNFPIPGKARSGRLTQDDLQA
jgi:hypothetical protein